MSIDAAADKNAAGRFSYVWEYRVDPLMRGEFERAYGPGGDWERLMSRHPCWIGTTLLRDTSTIDRYMTIDRWTSRAARDEFVAIFSEAFDRLDRQCEAFTLAETFVGDFHVVE